MGMSLGFDWDPGEKSCILPNVVQDAGALKEAERRECGWGVLRAGGGEQGPAFLYFAPSCRKPGRPEPGRKVLPSLPSV